MNKTPTSPALKGLVIGLILIVFSLVISLTNLSENTWLSIIGYVIFIVGIAWSISTYARDIDYDATFSGYFNHGFTVSAVSTCLMIIFTGVFVSLDPSVKQKAIDAATKKMQEQGLTKDQIDQGMTLMKKSFLTLSLLGVLVGYLITGVIVSLVTAGVMKKNPRPIFDDGADDLLDLSK